MSYCIIKEYNSDEFTSFLKTIFNKIEYFSVEGFKIIKDIPDNAHTMLVVCTK